MLMGECILSTSTDWLQISLEYDKSLKLKKRMTIFHRSLIMHLRDWTLFHLVLKLLNTVVRYTFDTSCTDSKGISSLQTPHLLNMDRR